MRSKVLKEILSNVSEGLKKKVLDDAANKIRKHILKRNNMERIPTKLIVEKGQVFTTDKPMPVDFEGYQEALKSWRKEAYLVSNPESIKSWWYPIMGNSLTYIHDGIYNCPDGLVFEVKAICPNNGDSFCEVCSCEQVAILSFKEPGKETGKLCNECGKAMCENFINHGSCGEVPDWTSLAYQPEHKFFRDNITADGKISLTPITKEPSSERPDWSGNNSDTWPAIWSEKCLQKYMDENPKLRGRKGKSVFAYGWRVGVINIMDKMKELGYDQNLLKPPHELKSVSEKIQSLEQEIERLREELKSKQ